MVFVQALATGLLLSGVNAATFTRRQSVPSTLPGTWTSKGCYDDFGPRTLNGANTDSDHMTIEFCIDYCEDRGFIYAGTEWSRECFCGNSIKASANQKPLTDCSMGCSGDATQACGNGNRLNIFYSGAPPPPAPSTVPQVGDWHSQGCYSDNVAGGRTLTHGIGLQSTTIETCTTACFNAGFSLAGTEYSAECYCGNSYQHGGAQVAIGDCSMTCQGNPLQFCGGPNRLNVYQYQGNNLPGGGGDPGPGDPPPGGPAPVTSGLPAGWHYEACYIDNAHGRIFQKELGARATNTINSCIADCSAQGYSVAGTEFGTECYCGNRLINGAAIGQENTCSMGCAGNNAQACGGPNRLSVYSNVANLEVLPIPGPQQTNLPTGWAYQGCFTDSGTLRVLPWQIVDEPGNGVVKCINKCNEYGYSAAGLQYGVECHCGDKELVASRGGVLVADSECGTTCSGDPTHTCGGGLRNSLYTFSGNRNVWHEPANKGRYEFFVPGVVVPLLVTLGINNKVTFLEKWGTGFPNTTGAYELDLSLANNFNQAWREMHVKTDVFCSGSIILPDKGGRQINIGGWAGESLFGIRFYTPDGSPGQPSHNDWEEDWTKLALQRSRWYPTAAMLANGSILVIGGEIGSNAQAQPNLEILPKPPGGDTVVELEWLLRTDPYNLYPFVVILPGGGIFVSYYNEARILNPVTFATTKVLPNLPGAVNNPLGGRTYPLEGASVVFPQHAPYTDPLKVLLCGGSTGPGPAFPLDNCVSIEPETPGATWTIERMPSVRVMPIMANLPDGTFLIMGGAQEGQAGFGLAKKPNLNAVLYDPTQPVYQRFSKLGDTTIARMYHSEATLLPDGRVLVSGSDPQDPDFPEEFRVEVYIPPYLTLGHTAPTFNLPINDWAYGGQYTITNIHLFQGSMANIRISLVFGTSSTHGNTMGARTIFPAFGCTGTSCTITAPPNANISPPGWHMLFVLDGTMPSFAKWVRIGGDPGGLGNWPNIPGFTRPGS